MRRSDSIGRYLAVFCISGWLVACGGGSFHESNDAGGSFDSAAQANDASVGAVDARVQDGTGGEAGGDGGAAPELEAGTDLDASTPGQRSALGPLHFPGPPFAAPQVPVRRLALRTRALCVVLEDRRIQCITNYGAGQTNEDFSARITDNRDFDRVFVSDADDYLFYGVRSDGSIVTWRDDAAGQSLTGAAYLEAFGDRDNLCGLFADGRIDCADAGALPTYPPGPYVQFGGRVSHTPKYYAGLRADGVIVAGPSADGGALFLDQEVFVGLSMAQTPPFCAVGESGAAYCSAGDGALAKLVRQSYANVRDISHGVGIHICAVLEDGMGVCHYDNGVKSPAAVPADKRFVDIETRDAAASCGVTEAGELWCWSDSSTSLYLVPLLAKAAVR
jgi:hypothetical protein